MKILIVIIVLLIPFIGQSQNINFIKSYGNNGYDYGRDIKQDVDTGYIATGSSSSFTSGNADVFLLKVDSLGNFKWSYPYGGAGADWGESVVVTLDSSYAVGGYTNSFGAGGFDFYLVRTNNIGVPLWEKTYGGSDWERAHDMIQLADSGFVLVGETYSYGNGNMDAYIIRTDKNGDTLWTKTYGGTENDYANAVLLDGDSLVVVGGTQSFGAGMTDGLILKYHIDGSFGWSKVAGMERDDYFTGCVKSKIENSYFFSGTRSYYYNQTGYLGDFWLYKISTDGNGLFADTTLTAGSHELEVAYDLVVNNNNDVYYCGETKSFGYSTIDFHTDAYLGEIESNFYSSTYGGPFGTAGDDYLIGIDYCYDDGVVAIGNLQYNSTGGTNVCILRIDQSNSSPGIYVTQELTNENITLSLSDITTNINFNVYPTLFQNNILIDGLPIENVVEVYDLQGKKLFNKNNVQNSINLSNLSNGMMIMVITTKEGKYSTKIIKE
jgi:hypothetical protein